LLSTKLERFDSDLFKQAWFWSQFCSKIGLLTTSSTLASKIVKLDIIICLNISLSLILGKLSGNGEGTIQKSHLKK
jgi:hypothetical protein